MKLMISRLEMTPLAAVVCWIDRVYYKQIKMSDLIFG